jgi:hypothetical protein
MDLCPEHAPHDPCPNDCHWSCERWAEEAVQDLPVVCYIVARPQAPGWVYAALDNRGAMASGYPYVTDRIESAALFPDVDRAVAFKASCDRIATEMPGLNLKGLEVRTLRIAPRVVTKF